MRNERKQPSGDFWGGPMWRQVLVGILCGVLVGAWSLVCDFWFDDARGAEPASLRQVPASG